MSEVSVFLMRNDSMYQLPSQPDQILVSAQNESDALEIVSEIFGPGYEVSGSVPAVPGRLEVI